VQAEVVHHGTLTETVRLTGKLALNEDHIARIHPLVEGRIHEIKVQFGDRVKAGQVLAVIDSQQVGRAKLELFKAIEEVRLANVNYQWQQTIRENTQALIASLEKGLPITEIEKQFADRPMGDYRQQLLAAYADLYKARADHSRLAEVSSQGVIPEKQLIAAKATLDAAQATFSGAMEQIRFTAMRNELAAKQELEKDQTTEAIDRELLGILGCHDIKPEDIDPAVQREAISHYELKAPFDGTVIERNVALLDQVSPTTEMFSVADFSTVWVQADVYERYLPLLEHLSNKVVRFRSESYPDRVFQARIFYLGNMVDAKTRTADMRAIAENPDRLLKPGMFVELELPAQSAPGVLQVPASAIQTHQKATFLFVQKGDDVFERRDVRLGRTGNGTVEITAGVKEGEPVVVAGAFALKSEMLSDLMGEED
jgi:cobalt-zinc-cadmium efflux system membrane fusion protein